ncbi:MAG: flagellar protein FlgN [Lachnospiraceae bacterium]|nr:flagellar protein FlgN [uncultured Agathobacter sp.]MBD8924925.1 flagellar protein FlgN [Agathobacter rectalis]MCI7113731.1 flagellar protein FlgN [Lachnobacterium sp.]MDD6138859.1 flagellar protein FlgN [Lachnospiraceae bacterium]MDY6156394.1 flagellar protein FlgN [Agathobacter sp.]MEE1034535.1 flagellar protein FlgN [Agathobacter sp.]
MASLVEELINVLAEEESIYKKLTEYGEKKRQIIIDADIPELEKLTDLEQQASDELLTKSNKQIALLGDIATVLGKTDEKMTVTRLIGYLDKQPDIQSKLTETRDSLLDTADQMQKINDLNSQLLAQAIEMTEFDITLFKSMRQAPETANYDKSAYNTGTILGSSGFDAKQ